MSSLLKKMVKPPPPAVNTHAIPEEDADGESSSASSSSLSSVGTIVPSSTSLPTNEPPNPWHDHFDQELFLEAEGVTHHVYVTPPANIVKDPLFVCHHGAGASGMSFALFATEMRRLMPSAGTLAVEARGHGLTVTSDAVDDFRLATLSKDLVTVIELSRVKLAWSQLPSLMLIGHSLGGAVVTHVARNSTFGGKLVGVGVIDVVEGSAMEALKNMQSYLAGRPASFASTQDAIDWHIRSRTIRNAASATLSTPPLLRSADEGGWIWRTDLSATKDYWSEWFDGMSGSFLTAMAAKLLILAGTDRLDKELMIGQMQGKFQLSVFPDAGHFVQEDLPEKTAELIAEFYKRNDRSALVCVSFIA